MQRMGHAIDREARTRILAWARHEMKKHGLPSGNALAKRLGLAGPTVTSVLAETRTPGLDFLIALHRTFHESADVMLDSDPPESGRKADGSDRLRSDKTTAQDS